MNSLLRSVSIIIPAYNESQKIAETLQEVASFFRKKAMTFEIIVVNDGSQDDTAKKVSDLKKDCPEIILMDNSKNAGKGMVLKQGIGAARYDYCLFMDADNSTKISEWEKFEPSLLKGSKAVVASRHLLKSRIMHPQPFARRFLGGGYRVLCRALFGLSTSDFNCGFKVFESSLAKDIFSQIKMTDWTFDVEIFCRLKKKSIKPDEVPVEWEHSQKPSHSSPWVTALRSLQSIWRLKASL